jgi:hypothetical protein
MRQTNEPAKVAIKAFNFLIASILPCPVACIERIVIAVAEAVGKMSFNSRATLMMKYLRRGVTKKTPKKDPIKVRVISLPKSSMILTNNSVSLD